MVDLAYQRKILKAVKAVLEDPVGEITPKTVRHMIITQKDVLAHSSEVEAAMKKLGWREEGPRWVHDN